MNKLIKTIIHLIFQSKKVQSEIQKFAKNIHNKNILEIGSGSNPTQKYFDSTNIFTKSDLNPKNADCKKIDLTNLTTIHKYDLIICINVLDDIYDYQRAVNNIYNALKTGGTCYLIVNGFYPLHDIPNDYWRFTRYSLSKIFNKFKGVKISIIGLSQFPSYYIVKATK